MAISQVTIQTPKQLMLTPVQPLSMAVAFFPETVDTCSSTEKYNIKSDYT